MKKFLIASSLILFLGLVFAPSGVSFAATKAVVKTTIKAPVKKVVVKKPVKKKKIVLKKEPLLAAPLLTPDPAFFAVTR